MTYETGDLLVVEEVTWGREGPQLFKGDVVLLCQPLFSYDGKNIAWDIVSKHGVRVIATEFLEVCTRTLT